MIGSLNEIKGVGVKTLEKLNSLGIYQPFDLINFLPKAYIDLDNICDLENALDGDYVLLKLTVTSASKPARRGKLEIFKAKGATDDAKKVSLTWFNCNYVSKTVVVGKTMRFYGKLKLLDGIYQLNNPTYEDYCEQTVTKGIRSIYPTKGRLSQGVLNSFIEQILSDFEVSSVINSKTETEYGLDNLKCCYINAHRPTSMLQADKAKKRIFLEETLRYTGAYRHVWQNSKRNHRYKYLYPQLQELIDSLPFVLTKTQSDAVNQIVFTMMSDKPLNALITGDVGSGKTIVALISTYFAFLSGYQSAVIAPTGILALQHFNNFKRILDPFGVKIALLLGTTPPTDKKIIKEKLKNQQIDIIIGTHAILTKDVEFKALSLAIIDEQHRFGVSQRTGLFEKGAAADMLTLSATPIPRTLRLSMLKSTEVIKIDRRFDSYNIITRLVTKQKRNDMLDYIINECKKGKQAYVVAPMIYDCEGLESTAVQTIFNEIKQKFDRVGLLHGKLKQQEKEQILEDFCRNKLSILVSTTVIEIGIDVPNASIMAIFDADLFGLATLHQLRGRIGRDGKRAYCFLYTQTEELAANKRLSILQSQNDGMKIAEYDYETRGGGDFMGQNQSGASIFRPTIATMQLANKLEKTIDYTKHAAIFEKYASILSLKDVVLN